MKRLLCILAFLPSLAFAQRGGPVRPITNQADQCASTVITAANCSGYERTWCIKYADQEVWACSPTAHQWEKVGEISTGGGGGGSGTSTIQESSSLKTDTATIIDFLSGFDVAVGSVSNSNDKVSISLDYTENPLNLGSTGVTGTLPVASGGTGAIIAALARSNLVAAQSGSNGDITALTNLTTPIPLNEGGTGLTTNTSLDDNVLIGQSGGTTLGYTAMPNCADSGGNHINYTAATNLFSCGNSSSGGGGSGYATIQNAGSGLTVRTVFNVATSGSGTALAAADNSGSTRTDITLTTTPTGATSVVGSARTITPGAGLSGSAALPLSSDISLATDSGEAAFLKDGGASDLTCGASNQGKMQAMDNGVVQWCDGATTSVLRYSALGDSSGNAATGDNATAFFAAGVLDVNRGGTGAAGLGTSTQVLFNDGGVVGFDETSSSFTYNKSTDVLSVGSVSTYGAADNARFLELQTNSSNVATPAAGFTRWYSSGTVGSEVPKFLNSSGTVQTIDTIAAANTLTNHVIDGNSNTLAVRRHATDCTALTNGVSGEVCYEQDADTLYVCEPTAGLCDTAAEWRSTAGAGGSGDITQVWQTASGAASAIVGAAGDSLDASSADFLRLPYAASPTIDANGKIAIDSTADQVVYESGGVVKALSPVRHACAVLESLVSTDDNYEFVEAEANLTVFEVSCHCRGTCSTGATFTLEDRSGNAMTITGTNPTCSTGSSNSTYAAVTAGNTIVKGEGIAFDVTNSPTAGDTYTICVNYTLDRQ